MHVQEKTLTLGKHQVSLKVAPIFNSVFLSISDLFFFQMCISRFVWLNSLCVSAMKREEMVFDFFMFP